MLLRWTIHSYLLLFVNSKEILKFITRSHTSHLSKYTSYLDTTLLHFQVPSDTSFASFKIDVEERRQTVFPCKSEDITLYIKQGAPPVINPDGSKFPEGFYNLSRPALHHINFTSQSASQYINFTSPIPGIYFVSAFISYTDPNNDGINQQGLVPKCYTYLDVTLFVTIVNNIEIVMNEVDIAIEIPPGEYKVYKFYAPDSIDHVLVTIKDDVFCEDCDRLRVRIQPYNVPSLLSSIKCLDIALENFTKTHQLNIWTLERVWYYVRFEFSNSTNEDESVLEGGSLTFKIKYFSPPKVISNDVSAVDNEVNDTSSYDNETVKQNRLQTYVPDPVEKFYRDSYIHRKIHYFEYDLVRERNSDSFVFAYDLRPRQNGKIPLYLNITSGNFITLKFDIQDETDSGGTAQLHTAIKPRIKYIQRKKIVTPEPKNHHLIGCLRKEIRELPYWPHHCVTNDDVSIAPILINGTIDDGSVLIPFPEAGTWYISFRLFCAPCEQCNCSMRCQKGYEECSKVCEHDCREDECNECSELCQKSVIEQEGCEGCDCEGGCMKTNVTCNTSIVFEVSSFACVDGTCGQNGKCVFSIAEGFVYTSCVCLNNYKGWDCSDNSSANSYFMIILEMALLTLSNLMFIPAVYIALKRQYYVESIVYLALCLSSIFYHACDAGDNIISYCITRLYVLQFSDFFCALLSLWVTLIAIASLPEPLVSISHMLGAIILAFGTTINKMSLWLFALPTLCGILIIAASWFAKYIQLKHVFPSKQYLKMNFCMGLVVVAVGLITFAFLQTRGNYKYLHSLWHVLMATGIIILLPDKSTFLPSNL